MLWAAAGAVVLLACGSEDGGQVQVGNGTGGALEGSGGASSSSDGSASGGVDASGGRSSGGAAATGGQRVVTGGAASTGGTAPATGGVVSTGGSLASGGASATGGAPPAKDFLWSASRKLVGNLCGGETGQVTMKLSVAISGGVCAQTEGFVGPIDCGFQGTTTFPADDTIAPCLKEATHVDFSWTWSRSGTVVGGVSWQHQEANPLRGATITGLRLTVSKTSEIWELLGTKP